MMAITLKGVFEKAESSCFCKKYYCTTCGGISSFVRNLIAENKFNDTLANIDQLLLLPSDFKRIQDHGFPKEQQCTNFVLFIKEIISKMPLTEQAYLISDWKVSASKLDNFLLDGIGYYLVPEQHKTMWLPLLIERANYDKSIEETLRIKYLYKS
ncbi:hypothetical protein CXF72_11660 [Psychromonas sp. MB-3u-54]|uniref:hypothetical protein n=1 Tax=Psychromonas sp. MB-3u-54 TaxID=2058319 RepID=UPI000C3289C6|nr:hypothetical protein [Psychromonas sp. MB-3u-54]PKH02435.1 hypothetical protein CXF72_11660 [Psychromonas sp. MB-3u-54]